MTRKRFVKLLMAEGYSRNEANEMAKDALEGYSYEVSYLVHSALRKNSDLISELGSKLYSFAAKLAQAITEVLPSLIEAIVAGLPDVIEVAGRKINAGNGLEASQDDNIHIKSQELCERCEHAYYNSCASRTVCTGCPQQRQDGGCKCVEVAYLTPCPYFAEHQE